MKLEFNPKDFPQMSLIVQNGVWNCTKCGSDKLGAMFDMGEWEAHIPDCCQSPDDCRKKMIKLADAK